jgi:tetratricopeptide (TPR) repeat protein
MAGRVNTKFVVILAIALVVLVGGVAGLWAFVARTDPQLQILRGDEFAEAGNWNKAVEYYGKALRNKRDDVDLILKYTNGVSRLTTTTAIDARRYIEQMLTWWQRASELDPNRAEPIEGFMGLYMSLGRDLGDFGSWDRMYERSQSLLGINPGTLVGRKYRGIAQVNRMRAIEVNDQDRQTARDDLLAVLDRDPEDAEAIFHLAIWNLLEARRVSVGALGDPRLAQQLRDEAVNRLVSSIERHPNDRRRYMDLLTVLLDPSVNDTKRAASILEALEKEMLADPRPPQQVMAVADMLMRLDREQVGDGDDIGTRGLQRAQKLLQLASDANPEDIRYRVAYGRALTLQQKIDEALVVLDEARKLVGRARAIDALRSAELRVAANLQYGDLLLLKAAQTADKAQREKLIDEVDQVVRFLRTESGDNASVNLLAGKLDMARGDVGQALKRFTSASDQFRGQNPEALLMAARAAMTMREWGAAAGHLQKLIEIRPDLESARLELARLYLQMQERDRANIQIQQVLRQNPDNPEARTMLSGIRAAAGDVTEIRKIIDDLRMLGSARNERQTNQLIQLLMATGDNDEARSLLAERFETNPTDLNTLQILLRVTGDKDNAMALIERSRAAGGDKRNLDFLQSQLEGEMSPELMEKFVMEEIDKIEDPMRRHLVMHELLNRMGQRDKAKAELEAAAKLDPDNATVVAAQFNAALQDQDFALAERVANKAAKLSLDLAEGMFYAGRLEMARGRIDEAISSFRRGLLLRSTYSEGHRMLADALRARNDMTAAVESYRVALEQKPDNVAALRGLAIAHDALRDPVNALAVLKRAVQFAPADRQLLEEYLNYEMEQGDPGQVLAVRKRMAVTTPGDTDNRRTLALLHAQQGQIKEAQQVVDDLVALQGMIRPNAAVAAAVKRAAGDMPGAVTILEQYILSRGDESDIDDYVTLGRFFMASGLFDRSLASYRLAIEKEQDDFKPASRELADVLFDRGVSDEAVKLYESLHQADPTDQRVALRYAETLLRLNRMAEAEKVLDAETKRAGDSVEALLLRSLIALQKGDQAEAVRVLDQAIAKQPNRAMSYFQRAQARAADPRAERQVTADLNRALELEPNMVSARLLRAAIARDRGDASGAIIELRHLVANNPNFVAARLQLVDLYFEQSRFNELDNLLEESARLFPDEAAWPRIRAQVAERRNNERDAIRFHAQAYELQPIPAHLGNLALAMLRANRAAETLDLLSRHADMVSTVPTLMAVRGRALHATGKAEEGNEALALAVARSSQFDQLQSVARQVRLTLSGDEAIQMIESAGASLPAMWLHLIAAQTLMDDSRWSQANDRLSKVASVIRPDSPERLMYLQMRALALYQTGAYDQAKTLYEQLNEAQPSNVGTLNNLAYLLVENLGQVEQGLSLAEEAAKLAPDNAQVLDTLGWAQYKAGQLEKSVATLRRSIRSQELAPNQFHLGRALMRAGDTPGARDALNRAKVLAEQFNDHAIREQADKALAELQP